jgi:hypothetical protein
MAQTTANLPNGGKTAHYAVSYDDGLPKYILDNMIRELQCRVSRYKAINKYIPPWIPVEVGDPAVTNRRLASLEIRKKQQIEAGKGVIESIEKIRTAIQER